MSDTLPKKYRADGGVSSVGLPLTFVALCATAVALGGIVSFVGQIFYMVMIFPIFMGLALIGVGAYLGSRLKLRSPVAAFVLGLMTSTVAILSIHWFDYRRFLWEHRYLSVALAAGHNPTANWNDPKVAEIVRFLESGNTSDRFFRYMNLQATLGVTITSKHTQTNLGYTGSWVYWGLELALVALLTTIGLARRATAPFCTACDRWKDIVQAAEFHGDGAAVVVCLTAGDVGELYRHVRPAGIDTDHLLLSLAVCLCCKGDSPFEVKLEEATVGDNGHPQRQQRTHLTYPGEALPRFEKCLNLRIS